MVVALGVLLRFTTIGLRMRAVVESRRLVQLEGINAGWVAAGAWMLSSLLAGLAGVMLSPMYAVMDSINFTTLLVAAIAAAAFGALRSIPLALVGGIVLGCRPERARWLPAAGTVLANGLRPAFPFVVLVVLLLVHPGMRNLEAQTDPLANVRPAAAAATAATLAIRAWTASCASASACSSWSSWCRASRGCRATGCSASLRASSLSTIFLSITMLTGMGGQLSLCQATFAGVGAFAAGQLAAHFGLPVLVGAVVGGVLAAAIGVVVAIPALRLSGLAVTIVTLAFALLADNVAFQYSWAGGLAQGVTRAAAEDRARSTSRTTRPSWSSPSSSCWPRSGIVKLVRKGTVGRYLAPCAGSEVAATSMGIDPAVSKVRVFALSAGRGRGRRRALRLAPADGEPGRLQLLLLARLRRGGGDHRGEHGRGRGPGRHGLRRDRPVAHATCPRGCRPGAASSSPSAP